MSYTPTSWTTGDTITASALNKIEQGIANAGSGGGGSFASLTVHMQGFYEETETYQGYLGAIGYFIDNNGTYTLMESLTTADINCSPDENAGESYQVAEYEFPLFPAETGIKVVWFYVPLGVPGVTIVPSGSMSTTSITVEAWGDECTGYELTGVGHIEATYAGE